MVSFDVPAWVKALVELKPRFLFGLCSVCVVLALLPGVLRTAAPMQALYPARGWLWLAALVFLTLGFVQLVPSVGDALRRRAARRHALSHLPSLSFGELLILLHCWTDQCQSVPLEVSDPHAVSLVHKGLLERAGGTVDIRACPHTVPDFVWRHIQSHPDSVWRHWDPNSPEVRRELAALRERIRRNVQQVQNPDSIGEPW